MIERTNRTRLGELLRHFVAGRLTNFDFEEKVDSLACDDSAVEAIALESWLLYDDLHQHRLTNEWRIPKDGRRIIARWICFLQTDLEYEWPYPTIRHDLRRAVTVLTFGIFPKFREPKYQDLGDYEIWPFFRMEDYHQAINAPKLLAKNNRHL